MSSRYENVTVYALDSSGDRHRIYRSYHYAGGCEYKDVIAVKNSKYQICWYPLEDKVEEIGEKLPVLKLADWQSYFSDKPTEQMCQLSEKAMLGKMTVVQFIMLIQQEADGETCNEQYICVTAGGIECKQNDDVITNEQ